MAKVKVSPRPQLGGAELLQLGTKTSDPSVAGEGPRPGETLDRFVNRFAGAIYDAASKTHGACGGAGVVRAFSAALWEHRDILGHLADSPEKAAEYLHTGKLADVLVCVGKKLLGRSEPSPAEPNPVTHETINGILHRIGRLESAERIRQSTIANLLPVGGDAVKQKRMYTVVITYKRKDITGVDAVAHQTCALDPEEAREQALRYFGHPFGVIKDSITVVSTTEG